MREPIDLSLRKFGKMQVVKRINHLPGFNSLWLIKCDCGRTEKMRQRLIPYCKSTQKNRGARYSCTVCHRGPCTYCGGEIVSDKYRRVCSDECKKLSRAKIQRKSLKKRSSTDSDFYKKEYAKRLDSEEQKKRIKEYNKMRWKLHRR